LRILIADDYETVRKGVCTILSQRQDLEVCGEAQDGREAIEKAIQLRPDLIILDITMPRVSGIEAAAEIRKTLPDVPILILSMHNSKTLHETVKRCGAQGYISKSEAAKTLLQAVDALLRRETFFQKEAPNNGSTVESQY
jgi:DNA-binding NarL/FixJ family response regulator